MTDPSFFTDGAAYQRMMGRWSQVIGRQFLDWLALPAGLDWLDVGCGNGAFTETLLEHAAPRSVQAIDPSEPQIAFARTRPGASEAEFHVADAQALPFSDNTFDTAIMALVIGFVPDPAGAVAEMARVTKPGGTVASYVWDRKGGQPAAPFRRTTHKLGLVGDAVRPGLDVTQLNTLTGIWQRNGLLAVEARPIEIEVSYDDFDDYWASSTALANPSVAFLADLSPADVERLRDALRNVLPADAAGRIRFTARTNAVKGRVPL